MQKTVRASSIGLGALVALLVAQGTLVLIESLTPVSFAAMMAVFTGIRDPNMYYRLNPDSIWSSYSVIHFVSFALGGMIAVRMVGELNFRLLVSLVFVAVLCSIFGQYPGRLETLSLPASQSLKSSLPLLVWLISAPVGIIFGAWVTHKLRRPV